MNLVSIDALESKLKSQTNGCINVLMAFKIKHNLIHTNVNIKFNRDMHQFETRNRHDFFVERYATNMGYADFFTRGLIEYNNLKTRNKIIYSISLFKSRVRRELIEEYNEREINQ
jgi:hypothetical protein